MELSSYRAPVSAWVAAALLLALSAVLAPVLGGGVRPLFVAGCLGVGAYAWSISPAAHLQAVIVLFAFVAFARRMVDVYAGFDEGGIMLAGPFLALIVVLPELLRVLNSRNLLNIRNIAPLLIAVCGLYAVALTIGKGDYAQGIGGALKWMAPLMWAVVMINMAPPQTEMIAAATRVFGIVLPVMGVYGIYHHIDPPLWDQYWLINAPIASAGLPEPYMVRTFSTMHAPAAFATFTAIGLFLVLFMGTSRLQRIMVLPAVVALLLSQYRTAWLAFLFGLLFCALRPPTRVRAISTLVIGAVVLIPVVLFTPFGEAILTRIASFIDPSQDYSGQERLSQFGNLWNRRDSSLFGNGFSAGDVMVAGEAGIDGMIASMWATMGVFFGLVCLTAVVMIPGAAVRTGWTSVRREDVVVGGLAVGWLVQMPLATIISGELGFLFWMTAAVLARRRQ